MTKQTVNYLEMFNKPKKNPILWGEVYLEV